MLGRYAIIFKADDDAQCHVIRGNDNRTHGVVWVAITEVPNVYAAVSGYVDETTETFHPATRYTRGHGRYGACHEASVSMAHPHDAIL